jgi:hypothetical protein
MILDNKCEPRQHHDRELMQMSRSIVYRFGSFHDLADAALLHILPASVSPAQVRFSVKGGRLIGVESGNMTDLSSVLASERKAWSGKCLAIVAADHPGPVIVTAQAVGMPASTVTFMATK